MNQKRACSFAGLFIIALVVSMPFYVADVYAVSLSITKNQGQAGIEGFIDAEGDTWTVEATIAGAEETVSAEDVKIKVGANEAEFDSCSEGALGTVCKYVRSLNDGITETVYNFDVLFSFLDAFGEETSVENSDSIAADGSAPEITGFSVRQRGDNVAIDFTVKDKPEGFCVGLDEIEIIDTERGALQTIDGFGDGVCNFDYGDDGGFEGILQASLDGEGKKWFKIKATDKLGHEKISSAKSFDADFVAPVIDSEIVFVDFGDYIGQYKARTDIQVKIKESGDLEKVLAYSGQADLDGEEADECERDEETDDLWICTWRNVEVDPVDSVSVRILAEDYAGNIAEKTLSKSFFVDDSPPEAVFFGTERTFDEVSYVSGDSDVENRIVLKVNEVGVGINEDGIRAKLASLGKGNFDAPDGCAETETTFDCYWDVNYRGGAAETSIGLSLFKDMVGNEGDRPAIEVQIDDSGPKVTGVELYGWSEAGKKDYFQSSDILTIEMEIAESNGLFILVDLNDAVMDAETIFPEQREVGEAGWQVFTEEDCEREEGKWVCNLEVSEQIKSGPDTVNLEIKVLDTAGNEAKWESEPKNVNADSRGNGVYEFDLLGVVTEEEPNFWEVSYVKPLGGENDFVDMDTTDLISTRMALDVGLRTDSDAKAVKIDLVGCEPEESFGARQREVLFDNLVGGATENPKPVLVLEFAPFNSGEYFAVSETEADVFSEAELEYTCFLNIYSQIGKKALKYAELQEVKIKVPFAFTELGSKDENLVGKIEEAKSGYYSDTEWISTLSLILDWAGYVANIMSAITTVMGMIDLISLEYEVSAEIVKGTPAAAYAAVFEGSCMVLQEGQAPTWEYMEYLQIPGQILTCAPGGSFIKEDGKKAINPATKEAYDVSGVEAVLEANWYFKYQRSVLDTYNLITGRGLLGIPAGSLYDNYVIAGIGLCVPGIIYNLKRLREIHCRKIVCLEQEVPQGIATVESCDKLFGYLTCEFVHGPLFALVPIFSVPTIIGEALKEVFASPVGIIMTAIDLLACGGLCFVDFVPVGACKVVKFVDKALNVVNSIIGFVDQRPDLQSSPYCDMVKDDTEEGEEVEAEEEAPVEEV